MEGNITLSGKEPGNTSYRWQPGLFQTLCSSKQLRSDGTVSGTQLTLVRVRKSLYCLNLRVFQNRFLEKNCTVFPVYNRYKLLDLM